MVQHKHRNNTTGYTNAERTNSQSKEKKEKESKKNTRATKQYKTTFTTVDKYASTVL